MNISEEPKEKLVDRIKNKVPGYLTVLTKHRFILVIIIVGIALSFALIKTRSFINIYRNEDRYAEENLKINYKQIDKEILSKFQAESKDSKIEVNSNFNPNRQSPFSE